MVSERNYVGNIVLQYVPDEERVDLTLPTGQHQECLSMDQVDSLAAILRKWVEKHQITERAADTARRRSQGARDGWEIRRGKQQSHEQQRQ